MKIDKKYLSRYYHKAAVDQLSDEYKARGYNITVEEKVGNFRIDMVARKEDAIIFFEIKTGEVRAETKERIKNLADFLKKEYPNSKFLLVAVRYPDDDTIVIDNLESILFDFFVGYEVPSELDELSPSTSIEDFSDVTVTSIEISHDTIKVECEGQVEVNLDYDRHESDAGFDESFPFKLKGEMQYVDGNLEMVDLDVFEADTSKFYE